MGTTAMGSDALRARSGNQRILPIDAARGAVMLFSCLAHFAWWLHAVYPDTSATLAAIGMVATPTFLLLSGAMVGMLSASAAQHGRDLKLFNRGLFLLTVGHSLIALAESHLSGGFLRTLRGVTVVDEIGLCTLIAAFFIPQLSRGKFCVTVAKCAALLLLVAWMLNLCWLPSAPVSYEAAEVLVGGNIILADPTAHTPLLQYAAIYAIGLPLGHFFACDVRREVSVTDVATRLASVGALLVSVALAMRLARYGLDHLATMHSLSMDITLKITGKTPPTPAYLLFFGGCGLMLIGASFRMYASASAAARWPLEWMAVIGRASLLIFVLQYFLFWTLPDLLNVHPTRFAPLLFIGNVLLVHAIAGAWGNLRGNRWLTFGIKLGAPPALRG